MKYNRELVKGIFIRRLNRFLAEVKIDNKIIQAHLPNSGRMKELLVPGRIAFLHQVSHPKRKTQYNLVSLRDQNSLVSVDSRVVNEVIFEALKERRLPQLLQYSRICREVTYKASRFDFELTNSKERCLVEVKSVTLVKDGVALFPDAPTKRGQVHLINLIEARNNGLRACIIFVIPRSDAKTFAPHEEADPEFAKLLKEAHGKGVEIFAFKCQVSESEIAVDKKVKVIV